MALEARPPSLTVNVACSPSPQVVVTLVEEGGREGEREREREREREKERERRERERDSERDLVLAAGSNMAVDHRSPSTRLARRPHR